MAASGGSTSPVRITELKESKESKESKKSKEVGFGLMERGGSADLLPRYSETVLPAGFDGASFNRSSSKENSNDWSELRGMMLETTTRLEKNCIGRGGMEFNHASNMALSSSGRSRVR